MQTDAGEPSPRSRHYGGLGTPRCPGTHDHASFETVGWQPGRRASSTATNVNTDTARLHLQTASRRPRTVTSTATAARDASCTSTRDGRLGELSPPAPSGVDAATGADPARYRQRHLRGRSPSGLTLDGDYLADAITRPWGGRRRAGLHGWPRPRSVLALRARCATALGTPRMDTSSARTRAAPAVPSPSRAHALALGFDPLVADYYWLQAVQMVGAMRGDVGSQEPLIGDADRARHRPRPLGRPPVPLRGDLAHRRARERARARTGCSRAASPITRSTGATASTSASTTSSTSSRTQRARRRAGAGAGARRARRTTSARWSRGCAPATAASTPPALLPRGADRATPGRATRAPST